MGEREEEESRLASGDARAHDVARRRVLRSATLALPLAGFAAPAARAAASRRRPVIAYPSLFPLSGPGLELLRAFEAGLTDLGYRIGTDITIDTSDAGGSVEQLPLLIRSQIDAGVSAFVMPLSNAVQMAARATRTIPIVSILIGDPVELGLADSPSRPTGNVTGLTVYNAPLTGKRLELLREMVPDTKRVGLLRNASFGPTRGDLEQADSVCRRFDWQLVPIEFDSPKTLALALDGARKANIDALAVVPDGVASTSSGPILAFAERQRLPGIYPHEGFTRSGLAGIPGLISFGPDRKYNFRRAAFYVDRLLKGIRPQDLPFEQPARFHLAVNRRAAAHLSVEIPPTIMVRVDDLTD